MEAQRPAGFWLQVVPALLYSFAIFYVGSMEKDPTAELDFAAKDKLLHLLSFFVMALVNRPAIAYFWPSAGFRWLLVSTFVITSLEGAGLEIYQGMLPHRSAELLDWIADSVGALLAVFALSVGARFGFLKNTFH